MNAEKSTLRLAVCIRNDGADDLEPRKVYQVLPDRKAAQEGYIRVLDESGEDYLYPAGYFATVRLPAAIAEELLSPSKKRAVSGRGQSRRVPIGIRRD
jgi:hypothetical protein